MIKGIIVGGTSVAAIEQVEQLPPLEIGGVDVKTTFQALTVLVNIIFYLIDRHIKNKKDKSNETIK